MFEAMQRRTSSGAVGDSMYGLNTWLAQESEFYPVFAMSCVVPQNYNRIDFQVEVTYNLVFRGVQAVNVPERPIPAGIAPTVAMCSKANPQNVDIDDYAFIHNMLKRAPDGQDANWLYRTFRRDPNQNVGATFSTAYGEVELVNGLPVMTVKQDAGSAVGYIMPFKMRKQVPDKACDSHVTTNSTLAATPIPI